LSRDSVGSASSRQQVTAEAGQGASPGLEGPLPEGMDPRAKVATVSGGATYAGTGGQIAGQLYVIDRAGNQSNGPGFRFNAEGRAGHQGPLVLGEAF
jgi:hypothetical protein